MNEQSDKASYILRADGQIVYEADTEEEIWAWVAVNLSDDVVFWEVNDE